MGWITNTIGAVVLGGACLGVGLYQGYKIGQDKIEKQLNAQPYRIVYQDMTYKFKDNSTGNIFGIDRKDEEKIKLNLEQRAEQAAQQAKPK